MDCFTAEQRSAIMRNIGQKDTKPEVLLRKALWARGIRYRKHLKIGRIRTDLVLARQAIVVFIDGCFWHGCPRHYSEPATNSSFWREKIQQNRQRDELNSQTLESEGWKVIRAWQCEIYQNLECVVNEIVDAVAKANIQGG